MRSYFSAPNVSENCTGNPTSVLNPRSNAAASIHAGSSSMPLSSLSKSCPWARQSYSQMFSWPWYMGSITHSSRYSCRSMADLWIQSLRAGRHTRYHCDRCLRSIFDILLHTLLHHHTGCDEERNEVPRGGLKPTLLASLLSDCSCLDRLLPPFRPQRLADST